VKNLQARKNWLLTKNFSSVVRKQMWGVDFSYILFREKRKDFFKEIPRKICTPWGKKSAKKVQFFKEIPWGKKST
jgi:hypothetical protein